MDPPTILLLPFFLIFLIFISFLNGSLASSSNSNNDSPASSRFRLLHRSEILRKPNPNNGDRVTVILDSLRRDDLRRAKISDTLRIRHHMIRRSVLDVALPAAVLPLSSGSFAGTGEYFVNFLMGTPAKSLLLVADTGSELTWTYCDAANPPDAESRRLAFPALSSSSFSPIPCSAGECLSSLPYSLADCPSRDSPCKYVYQYSDGSMAAGFYANETVILPRNQRRLPLVIKNVPIGCTATYNGTTIEGANGVLGLGQSALSFAVIAAQQFGGRFSYCLVDHLSPKDSHNYLVFGRNHRVSDRRPTVHRTPLILDPAIAPFYGISIMKISIDGIKLPIPDNVWTFNITNKGVNGGTIIDSGMTLTSLAEPAYRVVMDSFRKFFKGYPMVQLDPFELCYNKTKLTCEREKRVGPKLKFHLADGAVFEPYRKSYVVPVADSVDCIGFVSAGWPAMTTIGNLMQQNHIWEFDLQNGTLGFAPSSCKD